MIEKEWNMYCIADLCRNIRTDLWAVLELCQKTPSGRPVQNSSGQDNIFLDQDLNYLMLSISVFLFIEPHSVNSTEIWPVTMLWGLEINISVFQQCRVSGLVEDFHESPFLKTNIFIHTDKLSQPWADEKFLTELQVWLHLKPFHNYVIAQTARNSPTEEVNSGSLRGGKSHLKRESKLLTSLSEEM